MVLAVLLATLLLAGPAEGAGLGANPIRKVVTLLQEMQKEIVGILKDMRDDMEKASASAVTQEAEAAKGYEELKAAKLVEIATSAKSVRTKSRRSGELAVSIAQNTDALEDTSERLADTEKFLATLAVVCREKQAEWAARQAERGREVSAISELASIQSWLSEMSAVYTHQ